MKMNEDYLYVLVWYNIENIWLFIAEKSMLSIIFYSGPPQGAFEDIFLTAPL